MKSDMMIFPAAGRATNRAHDTISRGNFGEAGARDLPARPQRPL